MAARAWGVAWEGRRELRKFSTLHNRGGRVCDSCLLLVFVINTIIASPWDFHFWRTSLALVAVHRWNEPAAMSETGAIHLAVPLLIGAALLSCASPSPPTAP